MEDEGHDRLDSAVAAALYANHSEELRRFLWGVLRDAALVQDALQAAFVRLVERGGTADPERRKAWLFKVAFNEALVLKRRQAVRDRAQEKLAVEELRAQSERDAATPEAPLIRNETLQQVRRAIAELPLTQRRVLEMRVYEEKTFAVIAQELEIPLGTALGRMRTALEKLRTALEERRHD